VIDRKAAKQLLHIKARLERVGGIVELGMDAWIVRRETRQRPATSLMVSPWAITARTA